MDYLNKIQEIYVHVCKQKVKKMKSIKYYYGYGNPLRRLTQPSQTLDKIQENFLFWLLPQLVELDKRKSKKKCTEYTQREI